MYQQNAYSIISSYIKLGDFVNNYTLNIFTDASMNDNKATAGCFGAIAVYKDSIIDSLYWYDNRMIYNNSYTTVNICEAKGLRLGLNLALKYANQFSFINIFSDSLISVNTIRSYMPRWSCVDNVLYTIENKEACNQSLHVENRLLLDSLLSINPNIRMYHQNGHIKSKLDIERAYRKFRINNSIPSNIDIDIEIIKYISKYNNFIDNSTRDKLKQEMNYNLDYHDPVSFFAMNTYTYPDLLKCYNTRIKIEE